MLNVAKWTQEVKALLFAGDLDGAARMVNQNLNDFPKGQRYRIKQMRALYQNIRDVDSRPVPIGYERINLKNDNQEIQNLPKPPRNFFDLLPGFYRIGERGFRKSSFSFDMQDVSDSERHEFWHARFRTDQDSGAFSEFRIVENAYVCGIDTMTHAYGFNGASYVSDESARIAKSHPLSYRFPASRVIEQALLLPVPHHNKNYYHVMAEMIYGLRMASAEADYPIIYQTDEFDLLSEICQRLSISLSRLLPFDKVRDVMFKKAVLPATPPYFWNDDVFSFFKKVALGEKFSGNKIYLSRRYSNRGPINELNVEKFLKDNGFDIVYAERLSAKKQIEIFSAAKLIVSVHGAGLTNMAYMPADSGIVELFPSAMLTRDFYMRSRHNNMAYSALIFETEVDTSILLERIKGVESKIRINMSC